MQFWRHRQHQGPQMASVPRPPTHTQALLPLSLPLGAVIAARGWGVDWSLSGLSLKKIPNYSHRSSIKAASTAHSWCRGVAVPQAQQQVLQTPWGHPTPPPHADPSSEGPQPGAGADMRAFQELGSASCLGDQPWLTGGV